MLIWELPSSLLAGWDLVKLKSYVFADKPQLISKNAIKVSQCIGNNLPNLKVFTGVIFTHVGEKKVGCIQTFELGDCLL